MLCPPCTFLCSRPQKESRVCLTSLLVVSVISHVTGLESLFYRCFLGHMADNDLALFWPGLHLCMNSSLVTMQLPPACS